jgi:hypothetical protein
MNLEGENGERRMLETSANGTGAADEAAGREDDKKPWLWHWFAKADDFIAGLVLILLGAISLAAFLLVKHQDRDAVLKLAGGALILFTSYAAARTLALNRLDQRTGRIMEATKMLDEQSNAARAGALETLVKYRRYEQVAARDRASKDHRESAGGAHVDVRREP